MIAPVSEPRHGYVVYDDTRRASAGRRLDKTLRLLRESGVAAQGFFEPVWTLNFGWRHKLSDRITATFTAQDLFATNVLTRNFNTPVLRDHFVVEPVSRAFFLRFDYRFGGGKARQPQPDFQYENGGGGGGPGPGPG